MRHRNTLLAGIAALALIAGTGIASSQEAAKDQKAATQGKQPHAATEPMNHGAPGYTAQTDRKIGPSAQDERPATGATRGNRAEEMGHLNKAEPRETNENKHSNGKMRTRPLRPSGKMRTRPLRLSGKMRTRPSRPRSAGKAQRSDAKVRTQPRGSASALRRLLNGRTVIAKARRSSAGGRRAMPGA